MRHFNWLNLVTFTILFQFLLLFRQQEQRKNVVEKIHNTDWNILSLCPQNVTLWRLINKLIKNIIRLSSGRWEKNVCWSQLVTSMSLRHSILSNLKFSKNPLQFNVQYHSGQNNPNIQYYTRIKSSVTGCSLVNPN